MQLSRGKAEGLSWVDHGRLVEREEEEKEEEILPSTWIWSWGAGTHGQLASGSFTDHLEPLQLPWFAKDITRSIDSDSCPVILDMAGGGAHAVAVFGSNGHGQVVTWGNGQSGALGHGDESDLSVPKVVKYFQGTQICSVAAGWSHTAFVSNCGELYTCGNGSFGQLGHGDLESRLVPTKVKALPCNTVSMVACGMRHTIALGHGSGSGTSEGQAVYGFGSSKRGQLGIGPLDYLKTSQHNIKQTGKVSFPQRIVGLGEHKIMLLAANGDHSAALNEMGKLYLWGRGFNGSSDTHLPAQVGSQLRFSQVALGWNHCIALADGQLWAWGSNQRGQLGISKGSTSESYPLTLTSNISEDIEAISKPAHVMGYGQTIMGKTQCQPTAEDRVIFKKHVEEVTVTQSFAILGSCDRMEVLSPAAVTDRDHIDMGRSVHAGNNMSENHWTKMIRVGGLDGKLVTWLSAGAEHTAIVLEDGRIMIWGWGEHGQLGLGIVADQLYPQVVPIPFMSLDGKLRWRTFCGSGFTFAIAEQGGEG